MNNCHSEFDKYIKIWSGPMVQNFFNADCSIGKILFALMRNNPSKICQISDSDGTALTNADAVTYGIRVAQHLKTMGLKQDDVVGIAGSNTTYLMPLILGCLFNCTPFHAINPNIDDEATIKHLFCITRPKIIFCDGNIYEHISIIGRILKAQIFTLKHHKWNLPRVEDLLEPTKSELYYVPETLKLGGDQTVAILSTSGTTGLPKAVCLSNSTFLFDYGFLTSRDVLLSFSTIDWTSGFFNMLYSCGHSSTRIITEKVYTPEYLLELVVKYGATILPLTPGQVAALVKSPDISKEKLYSVRFLSIGGGNCHVATLLKMQEYLGAGIISYGYALTECGGIAANAGINKPNSVGKLVPGIKVKIIDDDGCCLGPGETGEILIQNGKQWNGYYGNPNETKRMQDYQGWFHTGDLGYFDNEHYLHVVNRKRDILKFHGMQYFPHEIEQVVAELPDVVEVCVFGLWNDVDGDAAAAAVVKVIGSKLSEQEVVEYVAQRLIVTQKQLHCGVFFVAQLPKTGSGKILRSEARDLALGKKWYNQANGVNK